MKCLLVADLHYDLRKFDWVVRAAAHVDIVVLAGDHLNVASRVPRPAQAAVVQRYLARIRERAPLLVSSGNHDLDGRDAHGEFTTRWIGKARHYDVPTDGDSYLFGDTLFTICPWQAGTHSAREIARQLARDAAVRPARWAWVYHAPPEGSPTSWDGRMSFGDPELQAWITQYQPDLVLSGHVHQSPFTERGSWADRIGQTWVFNAGHRSMRVPPHVLVDTGPLIAYWNSGRATELANLSQALARPFTSLTDPPPWLLTMGQPAARPPAESHRPAGG